MLRKLVLIDYFWIQDSKDLHVSWQITKVGAHMHSVRANPDREEKA
jgi:hypothetical protein